MYDSWDAGGWGPGAWIAMGLMMVAFWGLVVGLVVYLVRSVGQRPPEQPATGGPDDPVRILDERFARGAIDTEEYRERRELLRSG